MFCRLSTDVVPAGRLGPLHVIVQTGIQSAVHWIWLRLSLSFNVYDWVDGVMMTWFEPSEKNVGLERKYQNTEVIVFYCGKNQLMSRLLSNELWGLPEKIIIIQLLLLSNIALLVIDILPYMLYSYKVIMDGKYIYTISF